MDIKKYFENYDCVKKKQYDALSEYSRTNKTASEIAQKYGYTKASFNSLIQLFKKHLEENPNEDFFFHNKKAGRKAVKQDDEMFKKITELRNRNFSVPEIKTVLDSLRYSVSERYISRYLKKMGFDRLNRRTKSEKETRKIDKFTPAKSVEIDFAPEVFSSESVGISTLLPIIEHIGLDKAIEESDYPETKSISKLSSLLSFIALKSSDVRRYTVDDLWCMDRGLGLFAKMNVLPKAAWFSSYSHRVTSDMNINFLKFLHKIWEEQGLLSDTVNLDFTTIPYWGESEHLENNWSGKRNKALSGISAILAQDQDSGVIDFGSAKVKHKTSSDTILEFLDFRKENDKTDELKYLIFDSKLTNYQNLGKLNRRKVNFVTIRRRGKNIVEYLKNIDSSKKKRLRVECAGNKHRTIFAYEEFVVLEGYNKKGVKKEDEEKVRQISITGHGKIKPAIIITNDFDLPIKAIVRKYARRWLVEKGISEQVHFFHLNNVSSSMVIKVDFDLVMTIVTNNLFRILAMQIDGYENISAQKLYEKFLKNSGEVKITTDEIIINLKKKKNLPAILETMKQFEIDKSRILKGKKLIFEGATHS